MIDIKFLRENPDAVRENIKKKFQDEKLPLVDEVIKLDEERRSNQQKADEIRAHRNKISKEIGTELVNLPEKIKEISLGMKLEEIVAILGDKYACLAETEYGKTYAWYDTWENGVGISFDNNNISTYMTGAGAYQY